MKEVSHLPFTIVLQGTGGIQNVRIFEYKLNDARLEELFHLNNQRDERSKMDREKQHQLIPKPIVDDFSASFGFGTMGTF